MEKQEHKSWVLIMALFAIVIALLVIMVKRDTYWCGHRAWRIRGVHSVGHHCSLSRAAFTLEFLRDEQEKYKDRFGRYAPDLQAFESIGLRRVNFDRGGDFEIAITLRADSWSAVLRSRKFEEVLTISKSQPVQIVSAQGSQD
jgi:hypothetical protein